MSEEKNALSEELNEIVDKSFAGEIPWIQQNSTTYLWLKETSNSSYKSSIQRAESTVSSAIQILGATKPTYLFQVQDRESKITIVSLSSKERPELHNVLEYIYKGAERGIDISSSKILKNILNDE